MTDFNENYENENVKDVFDNNDIENNKAFAVLSYISILVLVPIFAAKESRFARFHANQGLVLFIVEVVIMAIINLLRRIPLLGWVFGIVGFAFSIIFLVWSIIGIMNAARGEARSLPLIGGVKIIKW